MRPLRKGEKAVAKVTGHTFVITGDRPLGQGGSGTVYAATFLDLDELPVALKVIPWIQVQNDETLDQQHTDPKDRARRVFREIRVAKAINKLAQPNLVKTFEMGETTEGMFFLAMELLQGYRSLRQILKQHERLPWTMACHIVKEIANALTTLHEMNIVHRDLSPNNILLFMNDWDNLQERPSAVKLIDYGTSIYADETLRSVVIQGTPGYTAPEHMQPGSMDARADQFVLATLCVEMLAGCSPYRKAGESFEKSFLRTLEAPPEAELQALDLPPRATAAIRRAWRQNPAERFDLVGLFADELLQAGPPPPSVDTYKRPHSVPSDSLPTVYANSSSSLPLPRPAATKTTPASVTSSALRLSQRASRFLIGSLAMVAMLTTDGETRSRFPTVKDPSGRFEQRPLGRSTAAGSIDFSFETTPAMASQCAPSPAPLQCIPQPKRPTRITRVHAAPAGAILIEITLADKNPDRIKKQQAAEKLRQCLLRTPGFFSGKCSVKVHRVGGARFLAEGLDEGAYVVESCMKELSACCPTLSQATIHCR